MQSMGATSTWHSCCTTSTCSRILVDLADLQTGPGTDRGAVLLPWRTCASRPSHGWEPEVPDHAGPRTGADGCNRVLLQTLRTSPCFAATAATLFHYLSFTGCPAGPSEILIC